MPSMDGFQGLFGQFARWAQRKVRAKLGSVHVESVYSEINMGDAVITILLALVGQCVLLVVWCWGFPPKSTFLSTPMIASPAQAFSKPDKCTGGWTDMTTYGQTGVQVPFIFPAGKIYVHAPVRPTMLQEVIPTLNCSAPIAPGTVADVQWYNGWEQISGQHQCSCSGSQDSHIVVVASQGDLHANCAQAYGRLGEMLRFKTANRSPEDRPGPFGYECAAYYNDPLMGHRIMFTTMFRWPFDPERLSVNLQVWIICPGVAAVAAFFGVSGLNGSQLAALNQPKGLCGRWAQNGRCVQAFYNRSLASWAPTSEILMVEVGVLNLGDSVLYAAEIPEELQSFRSHGYMDFGPYRDEWASNHSLERPLAGNISILYDLGEVLADTHSQAFGDLQYLARSCPGRSYSLAEDIEQFTYNDGKDPLIQLAADYARSTPFTFMCTEEFEPSPLERAAKVWPIVSAVNIALHSFALQLGYGCVGFLRRKWTPGARDQLHHASHHAVTTIQVLPV